MTCFPCISSHQYTPPTKCLINTVTAFAILTLLVATTLAILTATYPVLLPLAIVKGSGFVLLSVTACLLLRCCKMNNSSLAGVSSHSPQKYLKNYQPSTRNKVETPSSKPTDGTSPSSGIISGGESRIAESGSQATKNEKERNPEITISRPPDTNDGTSPLGQGGTRIGQVDGDDVVVLMEEDPESEISGETKLPDGDEEDVTEQSDDESEEERTSEITISIPTHTNDGTSPSGQGETRIGQVNKDDVVISIQEEDDVSKEEDPESEISGEVELSDGDEGGVTEQSDDESEEGSGR